MKNIQYVFASITRSCVSFWGVFVFLMHYPMAAYAVMGVGPDGIPTRVDPGIPAPGDGGLGGGAGDNFSNMSINIMNAMAYAPGLISATAYMTGLALAYFAVMRLKDYVENPRNYFLKDALVRFGASGALLALPFLYEVMTNNISAAAVSPMITPTRVGGITVAQVLGPTF